MTAFIICGTHSGVGKTTASFAVMSLLKEKGYVVQPFKQGPDFIDPGYHRFATGRHSIHLDFWMMRRKEIVNVFSEAMRDVDIGVVEGMGAIFDGHNGTHRGCGADLASLLRLPIVLVVDIFGMTRSVAALLQGFCEYHSSAPIAAILFNRAGSQTHYEMVLHALPQKFRSLSLGYLPNLRHASIPERHLGLLTIEENAQVKEMQQQYLECAKETLQLDRFIQKISKIQKKATQKMDVSVKRLLINKAARSTVHANPIRIGVAQDQAFCFYYQENLKILERQGAKLVYFSPLYDTVLPDDLDALYLGGGYPELFAERLRSNESIKSQIVQSADAGMPIYAECGGFIYLCRQLILDDNIGYVMTGIFPHTIRWDKTFLAIRYVQVKTVRKTILGPKNTLVKGQEFHQTRIDDTILEKIYAVKSSIREFFFEGYCTKNVVGSYIHLFFPSNPCVAENFVKHCRLYQRKRNDRLLA